MEHNFRSISRRYRRQVCAASGLLCCTQGGPLGEATPLFISSTTGGKIATRKNPMRSMLRRRGLAADVGLLPDLLSFQLRLNSVVLPVPSDYAAEAALVIRTLHASWMLRHHQLSFTVAKEATLPKQLGSQNASLLPK